MQVNFKQRRKREILDLGEKVTSDKGNLLFERAMGRNILPGMGSASIGGKGGADFMPLGSSKRGIYAPGLSSVRLCHDLRAKWERIKSPMVVGGD